MAAHSPKIILGSKSAARQAILKEMGFEYTIITADIDEKAIRRDKPEDLVMALAEAKAEAILSKLATLDVINCKTDSEPTLLITADQVVVHEGLVREKPCCEEEARHFIKGYSMAAASTVGSVLVINLTTGKKSGGWDTAEIYFHQIPDEVIDSLINEGSVLYVAGGLMVEHPLISPLIDAIASIISTLKLYC
eukprot:c25333_g1_i3 orf=182-760(+)